MFFITWGSRTKFVTVGQGAFHCPSCHNVAGYSHQEVRRYFTLYSIPLFSEATLGEFIECTRCRSKFQPFVLTLSPGQIEEMQKPWECVGCKCLNPPSEIRCLNCKERRPTKRGSDQAAPARAEKDNGAFQASPRASGTRPTTANAQNDSRGLAAVMASNKCDKCGVVNSLVALHCKACGSRLGADRGEQVAPN